MRILTLTLAIAAILAGCAALEPERNPRRHDIFAEVCRDLEVDCSTLAAPIIVISDTVASRGYLGFTYPHEDYVFVNPHVESWTNGAVTIDDVIYHETVHYVHHNIDYPGYCESERIARILTAERQGVEYDPAWEQRYGCTETD